MTLYLICLLLKLPYETLHPLVSASLGTVFILLIVATLATGVLAVKLNRVFDAKWRDTGSDFIHRWYNDSFYFERGWHYMLAIVSRRYTKFAFETTEHRFEDHVSRATVWVCRAVVGIYLLGIWESLLAAIIWACNGFGPLHG